MRAPRRGLSGGRPVRLRAARQPARVTHPAGALLGTLAAAQARRARRPAVVASAGFLIAAFQRWAPPAMLGQLMAVLLVAAIGAFQLSVFLAGLIVQTSAQPRSSR